MKSNAQTKTAVGALIALAATTSLLAATVQPASADPVRPYAAVGADTAADVWNGLTNEFGAAVPSAASYDAVQQGTSGQSSIRTKTGGSWFLRPQGSLDGLRALSAASDPTWTTHLYPGVGGAVLNHSDVDFVPSSVGPSAGVGLKYLPFARDAVSIAYKPYSTLSSSLNLSTGQIQELYTGNDNPGDSVVQFSAQPATATTVVTINGVVVHPLIPQTESGIRHFFLIAAGLNFSTLAPYIPVSNLPFSMGGLPENDGSVLSANGDLIPFSAAPWIAQGNGVSVNTTAGLAMASINGQAAVSGSAPTLVPGAMYGPKNVIGNYNTTPTSGLGTFYRDIYNVVPTAYLTGTPQQTALVSILTGLGSATGSSVIKSYGFGALSYIGNTASFIDGAYQH